MERNGMGKRLVDLRKEKHDTQEFVAEAIGITTEYLSKIENNKKVPSIDVTKRLARYYNRTLDYIVYGTKSRECKFIHVDEEIDTRTQKMLQDIVDSIVNNIRDYEQEKVS